VLAGVDDGPDRVQGLIGQLGSVDDLLVVGVALGRQRLDQRDEPVVAAGPQIGGCVAQRVQVHEAHGVTRVALDVGLLGIPAEPLRLDPVARADRRLEPELRRAGPVFGRQARDHPRLLRRRQSSEANLQLELVPTRCPCPSWAKSSSRSQRRARGPASGSSTVRSASMRLLLPALFSPTRRASATGVGLNDEEARRQMAGLLGSAVSYGRRGSTCWSP
jgi:hypothetical protein